MKTITLASLLAYSSIMGLLSSPTASAQSCSSLPPSTPAPRFIRNGNGTVSDQQTGLMWKQCLEGQRGVNCMGQPNFMSWDTAKHVAGQLSHSRFAGYSDWRLPTVQELETIVEKQCQAPAINLQIFPHSPSQGVWSVSEANYNAWSMDFGQGRAFPAFKAGGKNVRLVRNGH